MSKNQAKNREMPYTDLLQVILPIFFIVIWILDSFIFQFTTWLNEFIPSIIKFIIFATIFAMAIILIFTSHKSLFHDHKPSTTLITTGILGRVRHPLYLGILLIYISLIVQSISLICIGIFLIYVIIYNKMANYEEKVLEELFGEEYLEYKKKVPKWFPKII